MKITQIGKKALKNINYVKILLIHYTHHLQGMNMNYFASTRYQLDYIQVW